MIYFLLYCIHTNIRILVHLVQFRNSQAISPESQAMCYDIVNVKAGAREDRHQKPYGEVVKNQNSVP